MLARLSAALWPAFNMPGEATHHIPRPIEPDRRAITWPVRFGRIGSDRQWAPQPAWMCVGQPRVFGTSAHGAIMHAQAPRARIRGPANVVSGGSNFLLGSNRLCVARLCSRLDIGRLQGVRNVASARDHKISLAQPLGLCPSQTSRPQGQYSMYIPQRCMQALLTSVRYDTAISQIARMDFASTQPWDG